MERIAPQHSAVDWLTLTATTAIGKARLAVKMDGIIEAEVASGAQKTEWSWMGYNGFTVGPISYGERLGGSIAVLKGALADIFFDELGPIAERVTRMDLAVTVDFDRALYDVARETFNHITSLEKPRRDMKGSRFIIGLGGGQTCYIGKRGKVAFGRIYDKGVQEASMLEGRKWRWEVQLKRPLAGQVCRSMLEAESKREFIAAYVHGWFQPNVKSLPWTPSGSYYLIERDSKIRSPDVTINWLTRTVRPVILKLIEQGLYAEVEDALQLPIFGDDFTQKGVV